MNFLLVIGAFPSGYPIVCIGQAICAFGQPFIQNSPVSFTQ